MEKKPGRRSFIKNISAGSAAAFFPVEELAKKVIVEDRNEEHLKTQESDKATTHIYNGTYQGENLNRVAFPIGGLGAGMFCMEGTGAISHVSVRNKPEIFNEPGMYAAISVKGKKNGAKLLEGLVPDWKKFGQLDAGNGSGGATAGLPH